MKIPEEFFGTLKEVKSNCRKIVTKLKNGKTMEEIFENTTYLDTNDYPESLIWLDKAWSMLGSQQHFIVMQLAQSLFADKRLTVEQLSRIKEKNLKYLSSTEWGTLILNDYSGAH
mgnify:FL=1